MYDVVIVGAGSADCVLANRLSADRTRKVALIEAGGAQHRAFKVRAPGAWPDLFRTKLDWGFRTEPQADGAGRRHYWPRGKLLGGTSCSNAMVYMRGHRDNHDGWRDLGNPGWGYDDVLPYFKKSEDNVRGASAFHGAGGPLFVDDHPVVEVCDAFARATAAPAPRRAPRAARPADPAGRRLFPLAPRGAAPRHPVPHVAVRLVAAQLRRADAAPVRPLRRHRARLIYPRSHGELRLRSADPAEAPIIDPRYFSDPADLDHLVAGVKLTREIAATGPLRELLGAEVVPGPAVVSDDELRANVRATCNTIFHPTGTCKMGTDPLAVVDPTLRVHGLRGLRVADASIMPRIVGGNANAPTIMIAEKCADLYLAEA